MRNISFALTTKQIRNQSKTVTRRLGWHWLKLGELLQPVVKGQGIPKGGHVQKIGKPIRVVDVTREPLATGVSQSDVMREGFPRMSPQEFVEMFCQHNGCRPTSIVTRIVFSYTAPALSVRRTPPASAHATTDSPDSDKVRLAPGNRRVATGAPDASRRPSPRRSGTASVNSNARSTP